MSGSHQRARDGSGGLALGIDAGSSSARWLLVDAAGVERGSGRLGAISAIDLLREGASGQAAERLRELLAEVAAVGSPARVVAGVTGLDEGSSELASVRGTVAGALQLADAAVTVLPDIYIAYLSAFRAGAGVVVYAGTGSIALHLTADGEALRAGGHGYLLDDAGGAYWIGREALKLVLRRADEAGGPASGILAQALYAALGGSGWPHIRREVYQGGRSRVAALASAVSLAAGRGDDDAAELLAAAGRELARLANVLSGRLGQVLPVAIAGGVARAGAPLTDALRDALARGATLTPAAGTPVAAAAALAARLLSGEAELPPKWR